MYHFTIIANRIINEQQKPYKEKSVHNHNICIYTLYCFLVAHKLLTSLIILDNPHILSPVSDRLNSPFSASCGWIQFTCVTCSS